MSQRKYANRVAERHRALWTKAGSCGTCVADKASWDERPFGDCDKHNPCFGHEPQRLSTPPLPTSTRLIAREHGDRPRTIG
jgi:hypothetical protein